MSGLRRIMALDHGEARIGIALSDPLGLFARPFRVIRHTRLGADLAELCAIIRQEQVTKIVIGLPTDSQGGVGPQAEAVLRWARRLAELTSVPIVFWDESYSSAAAEELRRGSRKRRGQPLDDLAAAAILTEYLEAGGANHEPGQPLEAFPNP